MSSARAGPGDLAPEPRPAGAPRWRIGLLAILAFGLLLRLWVWPHHLIDPDEGAHLMDARLALRGLVPFVDYAPRQVLYTYVLAAFVWLVGPDYSRVRLCVALTDPVVATLIFILARRLVNTRAGLLAAGAYMLLPPVWVSSPTVHIEPFAALAACVAVYCLIRHLQSERLGTLAAAGALVAVAVYIRESNLAGALASVVTLTICTWRRPRLLAARVATFLAGFAVPCLLVRFLVGGTLTTAEWWATRLNPFYEPIRQLGVQEAATIRAHGAASLRQAVVGARLPGQPWAATWDTLRQAALEFAPLLAGLVIAILLLAAARRRAAPRLRLAGAVLLPWLGALALAYGYWSIHRGFYAEYTLEFLPALTILFGFASVELIRCWGLEREFGPAILGLSVYAAASFAGARLGLIEPSRFSYVAVAVLLVAIPSVEAQRRGRWRWLCLAVVGLAALGAPLALPRVVRRGLGLLKLAGALTGGWLVARARRGPAPGWPSVPAYLGLVLLVGTVGICMTAAGRRLRLEPPGEWSAATVREIAESLRQRGRPGDEVISGAVIWEFTAGLEPFARITHPLKFELGVSPRQAAALDQHFGERPPRFIVLDGFTERTWGAVLADWPRALAARYRHIVTVGGDRFPVQLYELRPAD